MVNFFDYYPHCPFIICLEKHFARLVRKNYVYLILGSVYISKISNVPALIDEAASITSV